MKNIFIYLVLFISIVINPIKCSGFGDLSYWIKAGINSNYITSPRDQYYDHSFPIGYSLGFSIDKKIIDNISISNTVYCTNVNAKSYIDIPSCCAPNILVYNTKYFRFSSVINIEYLGVGYLLFGYDIGRLLDIDLEVYNYESGRDNFKLLETPKFDNILCFGVGRNLKFKEQFYKIEMEYFYGLKKHNYKSIVGNLPEKARNNIIQLKISYRIN